MLKKPNVFAEDDKFLCGKTDPLHTLYTGRTLSSVANRKAGAFRLDSAWSHNTRRN